MRRVGSTNNRSPDHFTKILLGPAFFEHTDRMWWGPGLLMICWSCSLLFGEHMTSHLSVVSFVFFRYHPFHSVPIMATSALVPLVWFTNLLVARSRSTRSTRRSMSTKRSLPCLSPVDLHRLRRITAHHNDIMAHWQCSSHCQPFKLWPALVQGDTYLNRVRRITAHHNDPPWCYQFPTWSSSSCWYLSSLMMHTLAFSVIFSDWQEE